MNIPDPGLFAHRALQEVVFENRSFLTHVSHR
jgi:hypothetical protein